jgi:hypothetical protein
VRSWCSLVAGARIASTGSRPVPLFNTLLKRAPEDPYLVQQLALATYKSKQPDPQTSLTDAKRILHRLKPHQTVDAETLGLWGAVHKRLWELTGDRQALDEGIWALERASTSRTTTTTASTWPSC